MIISLSVWKNKIAVSKDVIMVIDNKNKYEYAALFCKCGCRNGVVLKKEKDDIGTSLCLVSDNFYTGQKVLLKEKLRRIWYVIRNKEYCYFDILIENDELKEFKDFVTKL